MHRTIFISDFHLGSRMTKAEHLLDFIKSNDAETWYLIGDIYDIKRLKKRRYWPHNHGRVIRALRAKARTGQRIVYIPGNHDPELRQRSGQRPRLGGIEVRRQDVHTTADGRRLLIIHGDEHEPKLESKSFSYVGGCAAYFAGVGASKMVGHARKVAGLGYWSLAAHLKDRALPRIPLMRRYRENVCTAARRANAHGVVCGHIHHAAAEMSGDTLYLNCGDWVDSCTALVEDRTGTLRLVRWAGNGTARPARSNLPIIKPETATAR